MEIFRLGNIEVIPNAFFIRDGINAPLCLEIRLVILPVFFQYLIKRKFRSKWGDMLFSNAKT